LVVVSDVFHSFGPAEYRSGGVELRIAEAALVEIWRPNLTEMCHTVFNPIFHLGEGLEAEEKVERAFEVAFRSYGINHKDTTLSFSEQS